MADGDAAYGGDAIVAMISALYICNAVVKNVCADASDGASGAFLKELPLEMPIEAPTLRLR